MYLLNKNVLKYAQIARSETESKIPYIEGCSNKQVIYALNRPISLILVYSNKGCKNVI